MPNSELYQLADVLQHFTCNMNYHTSQKSNVIGLFFHHKVNQFFVSYVDYCVTIVPMVLVFYQQLTFAIGKIVVKQNNWNYARVVKVPFKLI